MVTTRTIRGVSRRVLLTFLATAGVAGSAAAQTGPYMPSVGEPASTFALNDVPLAPGEVIVNSSSSGGGAIHHNGGNYQIIDSSSVPMAGGPMMDAAMPTMAPEMYGGYPSQYQGGCATGQCGRGHSVGYGLGGGVCGTPCNPYLYASLEGLYIKNTNVDNFTASPNFALDDFEYEFGVRGTVGLVPDCRNGMEISFTGPIEWDSQDSAIDAGGNIDSFLFPRASLLPTDLDTFENAVFQDQRYESEYFSVEANRTLIGWEICKLLYGIRYVDYDEDYFYRSVLGGGDQGLIRSSTENKMIGAQIGLDMTYPITCKMWSDVRARAGAYGNFAENIFDASNAATTIVRNFDDDVELAGVFELGSGVRYYVTDDFHVRAGTELWYLTGVATAIDQFDAGIGRNSGRIINIDDDVLMVGLSAGAELKF